MLAALGVTSDPRTRDTRLRPGEALRAAAAATLVVRVVPANGFVDARELLGIAFVVASISTGEGHAVTGTVMINFVPSRVEAQLFDSL